MEVLYKRQTPPVKTDGVVLGESESEECEFLNPASSATGSTSARTLALGALPTTTTP